MTASPQETNGRPPEGTALESVRRLEESLEDRREIEEAAKARLAAAREEAERIVARAREEALAEAERHRRETLAEADREAERIVGETRAQAGTLRALAEGDRTAATGAVLRSILPARRGA